MVDAYKQKITRRCWKTAPQAMETRCSDRKGRNRVQLTRSQHKKSAKQVREVEKRGYAPRLRHGCATVNRNANALESSALSFYRAQQPWSRVGPSGSLDGYSASLGRIRRDGWDMTVAQFPVFPDRWDHVMRSGRLKRVKFFRCEGDGNCAPSGKHITIGRQAHEATMMKVASMP